MATERIDIIVQEKGSRVVKRRLEDIGDTATRSVRGLRLLQNALFVLGGAGLLAGLGRLLDTITNFENRLRLVTDTTAEFNAVQTELFNVAARTRAEFESTATIFTRTALATRELGVSQQELLNFTESLNQATILSGASVREANAALIQLSQGMASGTLRGDELRSVLEQLPFVADVIAKQMGVTRGELRLLGTEGKINADIILEAFRNAREEIAGKFAETVPTVGQAFSVLRTEFLRVLDSFDDLTGGSEAVARAIIGIAESLNFLLAGLTAAVAGFAGFKFATFIGGIVSSIRANRELAAAVAQGNAVLLTSVEIERAKAATQLQSAGAAQAAAASTVRQIQLDVAQLQTQRALLTQQQASIVIDNTKRRARDALTGRFIAYNAALAQNIRTNIALTRTETALAAVRGNLTRATATQTAAEAALTTAQGRSAVAGAAANTFTSRLARAFPGLAAGAGVAARALSGLWAIVLANPIAALVAALVAVVASLVFFSDKIPIAGEELVTLRDVGIATFQLIGEAIAPVTNLISEGFTTALNYVSGLWNKFKDFIGQVLMAILNAIKTYVNIYIGLWVGLVNSIIKSWEILPAALADIGAIAVNGLIGVVKAGTEAVVRAAGDLLEFIGSAAEKVGLGNPFSGLLDDFSVDLDRFRPEITGAAREVGQIFNDEFSDALSTDYIGDSWTAILVRAREIAAERIANLSETGERTGGNGSSDSSKGKTFADFVRELTLENELLRENYSLGKENAKIIQIQNSLKRALTEAERQLITELVRENEVLEKAGSIFKEIRGPAREYQLTLEALNNLLSSGKINQDEFNRSIRQARIDLLDTQTTMEAGFERGFLRILEKTGDFATQIEDIMTSSFDGMSSAIADFVVDGEADFEGLIKSINKQLVKLLISQSFQLLFGNILGGGGGNFLFGGGSSLPSFNGGGSTGNGPRTGGVDGMGGFPAILHPRETVVDNTKQPSSQSAVFSVTIGQINANSKEEGASAARGFQEEMSKWQKSGEGHAFVRKVVGNPARAN